MCAINEYDSIGFYNKYKGQNYRSIKQKMEHENALTVYGIVNPCSSVLLDIDIKPNDKNIEIFKMLKKVGKKYTTAQQDIIEDIQYTFKDRILQIQKDSDSLKSLVQAYNILYINKLELPTEIERINKNISEITSGMSGLNKDEMNMQRKKLNTYSDLLKQCQDNSSNMQENISGIVQQITSLSQKLNSEVPETAELIEKYLIREQTKFNAHAKLEMEYQQGILPDFFRFPELTELIEISVKKTKGPIEEEGVEMFVSVYNPEAVNDFYKKWEDDIKLRSAYNIDGYSAPVMSNEQLSHLADSTEAFKILTASEWFSSGIAKGYIISNAWLDIAAPGTRHWLYDHLKLDVIERVFQRKSIISKLRFAEDDYEKFLVWYRKHKNHITYDTDFESPHGVLSSTAYSAFKSDTHNLRLDYPAWLKIGRGVAVGLAGWPQSYQSPTVDDIPTPKSIEPITLNPATKAAKFNAGGYAALPGMLQRGIDAANSNMSIVIEWKQCDNGIRWRAYELSQKAAGKYNRDLIRSKVIAIQLINKQYQYYNINAIRDYHLPTPFSSLGMPTQIINTP